MSLSDLNKFERVFPMKIKNRFLISTAALLISSLVWVPPCAAQATTVTISQIEINNDTSSGTAYNGNAVFVRGSFSPALPCASQGFFVASTDPFEKEIMATLLLAKASGRTVSFTFVYCHSNGYARGNSYVLN